MIGDVQDRFLRHGTGFWSWAPGYVCTLASHRREFEAGVCARPGHQPKARKRAP